MEDLGGRSGRGGGQGGCYLSVEVLSRVAFPVVSTCRLRRGERAALSLLSKYLCQTFVGWVRRMGKMAFLFPTGFVSRRT